MKFIAALLTLTALAACTHSSSDGGAGRQYFLTEVKPVLETHCLRCHNGSMPAPAMNLSSRATAFRKNATGQRFIAPGDPDGSLMITAVQRLGTHPRLMPRTDLSLTDDQIGMLREWIEDGAYWPADASGSLHYVRSGEHP